MTKVKDRCRWVRLKYGHDERARLGEQGAIYQGKWGVGGRGVHGLCLSISWSFDLEAGKAMSRNKCLGHDILSMLGHCILAIWWQMTEQRAWSHLWSNSIDMKPRASGSEHSRKELKLNIAASLFFLFGEWQPGALDWLPPGGAFSPFLWVLFSASAALLSRPSSCPWQESSPTESIPPLCRLQRRG